MSGLLFSLKDEIFPAEAGFRGVLAPCHLCKAGRAKAAIVLGFDPFQHTDRQIDLIAPALARFTAMKCFPAPGTDGFR